MCVVRVYLIENYVRTDRFCLADIILNENYVRTDRFCLADIILNEIYPNDTHVQKMFRGYPEDILHLLNMCAVRACMHIIYIYIYIILAFIRLEILRTRSQSYVQESKERGKLGKRKTMKKKVRKRK